MELLSEHLDIYLEAIKNLDLTDEEFNHKFRDFKSILKRYTLTTSLTNLLKELVENDKLSDFFVVTYCIVETLRKNSEGAGGIQIIDNVLASINAVNKNPTLCKYMRESVYKIVKDYIGCL